VFSVSFEVQMIEILYIYIYIYIYIFMYNIDLDIYFSFRSKFLNIIYPFGFSIVSGVVCI
jgi:hypothetical protein